MKGFIFIGRGGQGAKTAASILAQSAANQDLMVQAFPEYGPERMGAPVKSYAKISEKPIRSFSPIKNPDYVLLIDDSLIEMAINNLSRDTVLIINSPCMPEKFKNKHNIKNKIITIDATSISLKHINLNKPNIPIIGALLNYEKMLDLKVLQKTIKDFFKNKGKGKIGELNAECVKQAYKRCCY
jgi:pyruvate ferredoxin oxidoreductase gamma subunit